MKKSVLLIGVLIFGVGNGMDLQGRGAYVANELLEIISNKDLDNGTRKEALEYFNHLGDGEEARVRGESFCLHLINLAADATPAPRNAPRPAPAAVRPAPKGRVAKGSTPKGPVAEGSAPRVPAPKGPVAKGSTPKVPALKPAQEGPVAKGSTPKIPALKPAQEGTVAKVPAPKDPAPKDPAPRPAPEDPARVFELISEAEGELRGSGNLHSLDGLFNQVSVRRRIEGDVQMAFNNVPAASFDAVMLDVAGRMAGDDVEFSRYISRNGNNGYGAFWDWDDPTKNIICTLYNSPSRGNIYRAFEWCRFVFRSQRDRNNTALFFLCYRGIRNMLIFEVLQALKEKLLASFN
jgi:hypothetical protein